ncbi:GntR family transcriptional regulator [Numidum massiliense]|uniref:GntR family transcriptional regulator n=1 Tax=Numidum massiliense TaxID=1522315 RepID=UPI0006D53C85|nr:GntR family transcriptional regulator [Numidum massiliense]
MEIFVRRDDIPLYKQVYEWIKHNIDENEWTPGTQLPPEPVLSKDLGVSRQTLRQALQLLIDEGLLYRQQGKGTFVQKRRSQYELTILTSFSEQMRARGKQPSSKVIEIQSNIRPDQKMQLQLGLTSRNRLLKIVRLRLADETPMSLETVYIEENVCPGLAEQDLAKQSLYNLVEDVYRLSISYGSISLDAEKASPAEAELLQVEPFSSILYMECLNYTHNSRPLFITHAKYPKERYIFTVNMPRRQVRRS